MSSVMNRSPDSTCRSADVFSHGISRPPRQLPEKIIQHCRGSRPTSALLRLGEPGLLEHGVDGAAVADILQIQLRAAALPGPAAAAAAHRGQLADAEDPQCSQGTGGVEREETEA